MNSNTIREVLIKIISINKTLSEETLNKLLVASNWENNDVQEGMRIFRELNAAKPVVVPPAPAPIQVSTPVQPPVVETVAAPQPAAVPPVQPQTIHQAPVSIPPQNTQPLTSSAQMTPMQIANTTAAPQPHADLSYIKEKLAAMHVVDHSSDAEVSTNSAVIKNEVITSTQTAPILVDSHLPDPEEKGNTPWGFVLFDIFLFLIALGLLIFIFIK
jgi:hypothetical protein